MRTLKPVTRGELLLEEFLKPTKISQDRLTKEIGVPAQGSARSWQGSEPLPPTPTCACAGFFSLSNGYWLRAQAAYDTEVAERTLGSTLSSIKPRAGPKSLKAAS